MPCNGDCCVAFPMTEGVLGRCASGTVKEGDVLLAMLVPITREEAQARRERFGVLLAVEESSSSTQEWFSCAHWDEETRRCGNYEGRPHTCRFYPYGKPCEHGCDCADTWPEGGTDAVG